MEKWLLKELQANFPDVALEPIKSDIGVPIPRQMVSLPVKLGLPLMPHRNQPKHRSVSSLKLSAILPWPGRWLWLGWHWSGGHRDRLAFAQCSLFVDASSHFRFGCNA